MYGKPGKEKVVPRATHVKKGDTVLVTGGKDRGKRGKVLRVHPGKGTALVERVNLQKKHTRANPQKNVKGGILERESPVRIDKLQVICPSCNQPARLGARRTEEGGVRFCRKCNTNLGK